MREFKFRAWRDGELLEDVAPYDDNEIVEQYDCNEWYTKKVDCIEQYTGLKDKNGKEIYEGDILGIYHEYCDKDGDKTWEELEPWGTVIYEDNKAMFGVWADSPYSGEDKHFFELGERLEVVGNIHENKELLND